MADTVDAPDAHQYLTDAEGNRTHVLLTVEEYEEMLDLLLDVQDVEELKERRKTTEGFVTLEEMKARLGL